MKYKKDILKTCVLLSFFTFVSAAATPSAFADGPPESQTIGVGLQTPLGGNTAVGVNARYWSERNFGFEGGFTAKGIFKSINIAGLYTFAHKDTDSMYIRPYVGAGILHGRWNDSQSVDAGFGNTVDISFKANATGVSIFPGAEFTFKSFPKLSFGGDLQLIVGGKAKASGSASVNGHSVASESAEYSAGGVGFRINVLYYLK